MRRASEARPAASGNSVALPDKRRGEVVKMCVRIWHTSCGDEARRHHGPGSGRDAVGRRPSRRRQQRLIQEKRGRGGAARSYATRLTDVALPPGSNKARRCRGYGIPREISSLPVTAATAAGASGAATTAMQGKRPRIQHLVFALTLSGQCVTSMVPAWTGLATARGSGWPSRGGSRPSWQLRRRTLRRGRERQRHDEGGGGSAGAARPVGFGADAHHRAPGSDQVAPALRIGPAGATPFRWSSQRCRWR